MADVIIKNIRKAYEKGIHFNLANNGEFVLEGYCKECLQALGAIYEEEYSRYCYGATEILSYKTSYCKNCAESLKDKPLIDKGYEAFLNKVYQTETVFKYNGFCIKRYSDGSELEDLSPEEMRELHWTKQGSKEL